MGVSGSLGMTSRPGSGNDRLSLYDGTIAAMKMRKKSELPSKICAHCSLAFTWRKKWERDWDQVKYCSERCRRASKPAMAECRKHDD